MFRKLLVFTILFSMTLHCASRLGLLDKLHEHRHYIAYSIGLIEEVPIAMCNNDYDFSKGLKIETQNEDSSMPSGISQAQEINLFFSTALLKLPNNNFISVASSFPRVEVKFNNQYSDSVFHPPALG